jgi:hypothetical protein
MLNVLQSADKNLIEQKAYQQALSDFGIEELLEKISNYSDEDFDAGRMNLEPEEMEILGTLLIQHFINSLNGKLLGGFLNAIRHGNSDILPDSISQEIQLPDSGLPNNFPNVEMPHYSEGKIVQWTSTIENSDWGIVLGRFYAYASHRCRWSWKYVVLLDKNSPSSAWCLAEEAWEEDLEEVKCEK